MASRVAAEKAFQSVENVLGGKGVLGIKPQSSLDWVGMIREGIPAAAVESILSAVRLSQSELAQALGIPERTLARRKREGVLNSEESSKLLRLARLSAAPVKSLTILRAQSIGSSRRTQRFVAMRR